MTHHLRVHSAHRPATTSAFAALVLVALALLSGCGSRAQAGNSPGRSGGSLYDEVTKRGTLRVGVRVDNPPHGQLDSDGKPDGFDVDIAEAIAARWDVKLDLVRVDELTRISFLKNGKIDLAIASISKTAKRGKEVDFSQTYFFSTQSFLVRKGKISSLADLVGKRVGADRGSSGSGNWKAWLASHGHPNDADIVLFGDKHAAADAVRQGTIAGWAEDYEVLASYAKGDPSLTVLNEPGGIGLKLDGIAMRKNDSTLRNAVNGALQDIAASGDYDRIYDRWFGPDSATPVPRQGSIEVWPHG